MLNIEKIDSKNILISLASSRLDYRENESLYHAVKSVKDSYGEKVTGIIIDLSAVEEVVSYNYLLRMDQEFCAESHCNIILVLRSDSQPERLHAQLGLEKMFPAFINVEDALKKAGEVL